MAKAAKLKVFRTPIGFHDAYVAAPSQKAAIAAWGSDRDVFARGEAELVTDAVLTKEPLASPGTIVRRLRGTAEEQVAALGEVGATPKASAKKVPAKKPGSKLKPKPLPRPSRAAVDAAEQAIAQAETGHKAALADIRQREAMLAGERKAVEAEHAKVLKQLEAKRDKARRSFDSAMERWRN